MDRRGRVFSHSSISSQEVPSLCASLAASEASDSEPVAVASAARLTGFLLHSAATRRQAATRSHAAGALPASARWLHRAYAHALGPESSPAPADGEAWRAFLFVLSGVADVPASRPGFAPALDRAGFAVEEVLFAVSSLSLFVMVGKVLLSVLLA